jgi:FkbM family methyltransferase
MSNSKSQIGQDRILDEQIFKGKQNGLFIEVGAFNGVAGSNTYFFEKERGWKGMLIEPHSLNYKDMVEKSDRTNSVMENCAIDCEDGEVEFQMMNGACDILSGMVKDYDYRHKQRIENELHSFKVNPFDHPHKTEQNVVIVKSYKLQTLIDKHQYKDIDLCSIDVEGGELSVLKSIDFERTNIECFLIENNFQDNQVEDFLTTKGYKLINKIQYDDVYVKVNTDKLTNWSI